MLVIVGVEIQNEPVVTKDGREQKRGRDKDGMGNKSGTFSCLACRMITNSKLVSSMNVELEALLLSTSRSLSMQSNVGIVSSVLLLHVGLFLQVHSGHLHP